ncbi:hypothetical protein [Micromonospora eburnea]|uniref:Uncharacterized protein n=1 Tax=Micromonospora eburnea TaxID=227316 RepID=A0A1C6VJQ9_9ACTN|nr:hypothetical protein [Micromonospora eburnea]SCL66576.1 hypothetical protein GA0070604_5729 [Micromonospora eburnea]
MDSMIPRPGADPFCGTKAVDPVDTVTERLMTGGTVVQPTGIRGRAGCPGAAGPTTRHRAVYDAAVLVALAARHLLGPEVITTSVIGRGLAVQLHTMILARYVPWISHVSVFLTDEPATPEEASSGRAYDDSDPAPSYFDARVVDELDLAGIALARAASPAKSAFGSNLVVVAGPDGPDGHWPPGTPVHLAKGALLVNASGRDLPPGLANQVGQVIVDDLSLVEQAAEHGLARPAQAHHSPQPRYRLVGDLRQVVLGERIGRTNQEQVLLVELLSSAVPQLC